MLGVSTGHFSDIINDRRGLSEEQRREIASFFGYTGSFYEIFLRKGYYLLQGKTPPTDAELLERMKKGVFLGLDLSNVEPFESAKEMETARLEIENEEYSEKAQ